jgi:hypothetical protein
LGKLRPAVTEMRRLKALEHENTRLKKIVTDLTLDRKSFRMSLAESFAASLFTRGCYRDVRSLKCVDPEV